MTKQTPNNYQVIKIGKHSSRTTAQKESQAKKMKANWADPEYRAAQLEVFRTPEIRKQRRDNLTAKWQDPEFKEKTSKAQSQGAKNRWSDPAERQRQSERLKAARAKKNDNK